MANIPPSKIFTKKLDSNVFCDIPYIFSCEILSLTLNYGLNKVKKFDNLDDVIVLSSPRQHFVLDEIEKKSKIAVVLSDPYHLMGYSFSNTKKILSAADVIFATSKSLANKYLSKYYPNINSKVVYWPNTVDSDIWDINKFKDHYKDKKHNKIVGFAGNIMEITDLKLLDYITSKCEKMNFEIAGKINIQDNNDIHLFNKIVSKENVKYLGYIDYGILPEKVYRWDVGILIDKKNELSSSQ